MASPLLHYAVRMRLPALTAVATDRTVFRCSVVAGHPGGTATNGGRCRPLHGRRIESAKMSACQVCRVVAGGAGDLLVNHVLGVFSRIIAIVLAGAGCMTGHTHGIDVKRSSSPVGRGLATVATDADAAGGPVGILICRPTFGVVSRRNLKVDPAVIVGGSRWAGVTDGAVAAHASKSHVCCMGGVGRWHGMAASALRRRWRCGGRCRRR